MTCSTCRYWKADNVLGLSVSGAQKFGECRRYPPAPKWPSTEMEDWCGEFEARPATRPVLQTSPQDYQRQLGPSEPRQ